MREGDQEEMGKALIAGMETLSLELRAVTDNSLCRLSADHAKVTAVPSGGKNRKPSL